MEKVNYSDEFICPKCGRHTALVFHAGGEHQAHCLFCDLYYDVEIAKTTNADRIRSMSDEELAKWLERIRLCCSTDLCGRNCPLAEVCYSSAEGPKETLDWLQQEAE